MTTPPLDGAEHGQIRAGETANQRTSAHLAREAEDLGAGTKVSAAARAEINGKLIDEKILPSIKPPEPSSPSAQEKPACVGRGEHCSPADSIAEADRRFHQQLIQKPRSAIKKDTLHLKPLNPTDHSHKPGFFETNQHIDIRMRQQDLEIHSRNAPHLAADKANPPQKAPDAPPQTHINRIMDQTLMQRDAELHRRDAEFHRRFAESHLLGTESHHQPQPPPAQKRVER